jgi:hypothetical protein
VEISGPFVSSKLLWTLLLLTIGSQIVVDFVYLCSLLYIYI